MLQLIMIFAFVLCCGSCKSFLGDYNSGSHLRIQYAAVCHLPFLDSVIAAKHILFSLSVAFSLLKA